MCRISVMVRVLSTNGIWWYWHPLATGSIFGFRAKDSRDSFGSDCQSIEEFLSIIKGERERERERGQSSKTVSQTVYCDTRLSKVWSCAMLIMTGSSHDLYSGNYERDGKNRWILVQQSIIDSLVRVRLNTWVYSLTISKCSNHLQHL